MGRLPISAGRRRGENRSVMNVNSFWQNGAFFFIDYTNSGRWDDPVFLGAHSSENQPDIDIARVTMVYDFCTVDHGNG